MQKQLGDIYALIFARPMFEKLNKALFYLSSRGLGLLNYSSEKLSGEKYIINHFIPKAGNPIVFDVGANQGSWTAQVLRQNPNCIIHIFEPNKAHQPKLDLLNGNITVNYVGTGERQASMNLYDYKDGDASEHASLLEGVIEKIHHNPSRTQIVPITTIDEYCKQAGIESIHFLKIDTEGFEYFTLKGSQKILNSIKYIQFEFNEMNTIPRIFFSDFFELLKDNFDIYRILPSGLIKIKSYSPWHCEQFVFQNFLVVNKYA